MGTSFEKAGCHVIYGLVGLKTHAKIILIVRKEDNGIKRYLHLGTGNYNDSTAKLYTDIGLMTANDEFGSDASAFLIYSAVIVSLLYGINWLWLL